MISDNIWQARGGPTSVAEPGAHLVSLASGEEGGGRAPYSLPCLDGNMMDVFY